MATVKENTFKDPMMEKVSVHVPKIPGEDPMLYVGLNGKGWNIPRGKTVEVPKPVADIIAQSQACMSVADEYTAQKQKLMKVVQGA